MTTLVLLHGAPGEGALWKPVVDRLSRPTRVETPTLRWFGSAAWPDDGRSFGTEAHADDLIGTLEDIGDGPAAVAAWSYSSHVVLDAALRRPDLMRAALVYEPGLSSYLTEEAERVAYGEDAVAAFGPVASALAEGGPAAAVEALFESSGGPGCFAALSFERRATYLASARIMPLLLGGGQPPKPISAADLAGLEVPLTVACGSATRPLFEIASRAVARATGRPLAMIAGADHMFPETDPAGFAGMLDDWLGKPGNPAR